MRYRLDFYNLSIKIINMKTNYYMLLLAVFLFSCREDDAYEDNNYSSVDTLKVRSNDVQDKEGMEDEITEIQNRSDKTFEMGYFSGQAEIATYDVKKARYQGIHPGETVLIFVTEPFSTKNQVKADRPTPENSVKVLKMNRIDRFTTGIYDYSQFTSVFTPYEEYEAKFPLKITMGSQDWCGQSFSQLNNRGGFHFDQKSYFESEGDTVLQMDYVLPEDNIMNLLRISKNELPVGEFNIFPSISYLRNSHQEIKNYQAMGSISTTEDGFVYNYEIAELKRSVSIYVTTENQNRITKWEETFPTVFDGVLRTSTYELKGVEVLPYWKLNKPGDAALRKDLELLY